MPILHVQHSGQGAGPGGTRVPLQPAAALSHRGPCVQVTISLLASMAEARAAEGEAVPPPQTGWALIDTGASITCIDEQVAVKMGIPVVDTATMASATDSSSLRSIYPVTIEMVGLPGPFHSPRTMGAELAAQGLIALIGRDALHGCMFIYNGLSGQVSLAR
jgi:predicted aspartyl protease